MTSAKQIEANRRNALKSTGPRTSEGKAIAARNSLKHGLLARQVVIMEGEGAEDREAFDLILDDLIEQYQPVGLMEEMQIETIATCYWQLMRASRYEAGAIRHNLNTVTEDFYRRRGHQKEEDIDAEITQKQKQFEDWQQGVKRLKEMIAAGEPISTAFTSDRLDNWLWVYEDYLKAVEGINVPIDRKMRMDDLISEYYGEDSPLVLIKSIYRTLKEQKYTDTRLWQLLMRTMEERITMVKSEIERLRQTRQHNQHHFDALKLLCSLPDSTKMNILLRNVTAIQKRLNNAILQLERLQKRRGAKFNPERNQLNELMK